MNRPTNPAAPPTRGRSRARSSPCSTILVSAARASSRSTARRREMIDRERHIGIVSEPRVVDVEAGFLKFFAKATGETDPVYFDDAARSEEHTSELQSLMRTSYAVFCLKKKTNHIERTQV